MIGARAIAACIALLGVQGAALARAPVAADYRDWSLACDNTGDCHAYGVMHGGYEGGLPQIHLFREAGADGQVWLELHGVSPSTAKQAFVYLDGRQLALGHPCWQWQSSESSGDADNLRCQGYEGVRGFLLRVGNASFLAATAGAEDAVSLSGLKATLLRMDEVQGHWATSRALSEIGARPLELVPEREAEPRLRAAAYTASAQQLAQAAGRIERVRRDLIEEQDCFMSADEGPFDQAVPLSRTLWLVLLECGRGAYQSSYSAFLLHDGQDPAPLVLPDPVDSGRGFFLTSAEYDPETATLSHFAKGRGIGDCGETAQWLWDGERFNLLSLTRMPRCPGTLPGDYPVLWRARRAGGH